MTLNECTIIQLLLNAMKFTIEVDCLTVTLELWKIQDADMHHHSSGLPFTSKCTYEKTAKLLTERKSCENSSYKGFCSLKVSDIKSSKMKFQVKKEEKKCFEEPYNDPINWTSAHKPSELPLQT